MAAAVFDGVKKRKSIHLLSRYYAEHRGQAPISKSCQKMASLLFNNRHF